MKLFKNLRIYLILIIILLFAILLIANKYLIAGLIMFALAVLVYALWDLIIKSKEQKIDELAGIVEKTGLQISRLQEENNELRSRKLNISEIRNMLDLGLLQVNTNFTRTWNEQFEEGSRSFHFIGALQVKIVARYGIDLKEMKVKFLRERNEIQVANVQPKFLSFNDFDYTWKIAEIMEHKKPWLGSQHWRKSEELQGLVSQMKEDLRIKTHQEVKQGPEELEWVLEPLKQQINSTIQLIFGSPYRTVKITDHYDDSFVNLDEFGIEGQNRETKKLPL
jgi:hypothetical protein